jgi:hypothetical protein
MRETFWIEQPIPDYAALIRPTCLLCYGLIGAI